MIVTGSEPFLKSNRSPFMSSEEQWCAARLSNTHPSPPSAIDGAGPSESFRLTINSCSCATFPSSFVKAHCQSGTADVTVRVTLFDAHSSVFASTSSYKIEYLLIRELNFNLCR